MKRSLRKRLLAIPEDSFEDTFREFLDVCPTDNLTKSEPIRQFSSPPPPESTPRSRLRDTKPKPGSRRIFTEMEKQIIFSRVEQTEQLDEEERQNRLSLVRQRNKDEYIEAVKKRSSLLAEKVLETKLESVIDSEKRRNDILFRSQNVLLLRRLRSFIERSELWYTIVVSHMFLTNIIQVQKEQQALEKLSFLFRPLVHRYISLKRIAVEQEEFIRHLPNIPYPTPEVIQCMEGQFFRGWAPFLLESLTSKAQLKVVKQGKFLLHAGNVDRTMYMVTYGTVSILLRKRGDTCKRRTKENSLNLLSMDAPCYVGEFGLVCKERRTASVYCETDIVAWGISPTHYSQVAKYLDMDLGQKQKAVADERRKQNLRNLFPLRMDILIKNPYFKFFSENSLQRIIMSANPLVLHDGESLFERGELKSSAYIIQDGSVLEIDESGSSVPIAMGDLLGIFECVCGVNEKKKTSVVCVGDCDIWELTRDLLVDVGLTEPYAFIECRKVAKEARAKLINKENTAPEFFRSDAYLSFCFLPVHLLKIYRASTPVVFINGEIIIQLGTPVTGFLTLLEGTVDVTYFYKSSRETFRMSTKDILGELKEGSGEEAKSADKVKKKKGDSVWARGIHGHTLVFGVYEYATSLAEYACTIKSHGITEALFSDIRHVKLYTPPELQRIMKENSTGQQLVKRAYQEQKLSLLTSSKSSFAHLYKELKSKTEK